MDFIPVTLQTMCVIVENDQLTFSTLTRNNGLNRLHLFGRRGSVQNPMKTKQGNTNTPGLFQRRPFNPSRGLLVCIGWKRAMPV